LLGGGCSRFIFLHSARKGTVCDATAKPQAAATIPSSMQSLVMQSRRAAASGQPLLPGLSVAGWQTAVGKRAARPVEQGTWWEGAGSKSWALGWICIPAWKCSAASELSLERSASGSGVQYANFMHQEVTLSC